MRCVVPLGLSLVIAGCKVTSPSADLTSEGSNDVSRVAAEEASLDFAVKASDGDVYTVAIGADGLVEISGKEGAVASYQLGKDGRTVNAQVQKKAELEDLAADLGDANDEKKVALAGEFPLAVVESKPTFSGSATKGAGYSLAGDTACEDASIKFGKVGRGMLGVRSVESVAAVVDVASLGATAAARTAARQAIREMLESGAGKGVDLTTGGIAGNLEPVAEQSCYEAAKCFVENGHNSGKLALSNALGRELIKCEWKPEGESTSVDFKVWGWGHAVGLFSW